MRGVVFIALALFLVIAQTTAYHIFWPLSAWPDFILLVTVHTGLRFGKYEGVRFGVMMGFVQDLLSIGSLGIYTLSRGLIGFAIGYLKETLVSDSVVTRFSLILGAFIFDALTYAILSRAILGYDLEGALLETSPAALALTLIVAFPIFALIDYGDRLLFPKVETGGTGYKEITFQ